MRNGFTTLLNRVGVAEANPYGNEGGGFQVTLSAAGTPDLHTYLGNGTGLLTDTWQINDAGPACAGLVNEVPLQLQCRRMTG